MSHLAALPADYHVGETVIHRTVGPCTIIKKDGVGLSSYTVAQLGGSAKLIVLPQYVPVALRPIATRDQIETVFLVLQQQPCRRSFSYQRGKTKIRNDICSGDLPVIAAALRDVATDEILDQFRQSMRDLALSILVPEIAIVQETTYDTARTHINHTIANRRYAHLAAK